MDTCCCEFRDLKGRERHMLDCPSCDESFGELWNRYARVPYPGGSRKIRVSDMIIIFVFFLSMKQTFILPICDVLVMILSLLFKIKQIKHVFWLYTMMALTLSAYFFLSHLARNTISDSCILVTFCLTIILLCEVRRGPIYLCKGSVDSYVLTGTRKSSLKSAELPLILLCFVIVCDMVYFKPDLMSANVFAVVLSTTLTLLYLLGDDEVGILRPVSNSTRELRCVDCDLPKRPSDAKHCRHCEKCYLRFDHHCVWLDSCIGAGNHLSFLLLLVFVSFHGLYFISIYLFFSGPKVSLHGAALLHVILCTTAVLLLLLVQLYQIIFLGLTTYERIKRVRYNEKKLSEQIYKRELAEFPKLLRIPLLSLPRNLQHFLLSECTAIFS